MDAAPAIPSPAFLPAVKTLTAGETPRAWSLIISILGDLAHTRPDVEIGAAPLSRLLAPTGISAEAMRVALHRLKRDGWIVTRRVGRTGYYALSPSRRAEIAAASMRIYMLDPPDPLAWHLILRAPGADLAEGEIALTAQMSLAAGPADGVRFADALVLSSVATEGPGWLAEKLCPPDLAQAYSGLSDRLATVEERVTQAPDMSLHERLCLRALIVHEWRRLILRHPPLPDHLFPPDWAGPACRARVGRMLAILPVPSAHELAAL